jgi:hypothetical protein
MFHMDTTRTMMMNRQPPAIIFVIDGRLSGRARRQLVSKYAARDDTHSRSGIACARTLAAAANYEKLSAQYRPGTGE